jgi:heme exporter protein D
MTLLADLGGKYAAYVLCAYGVSALAFAWMIADTLLRAGRARRAARRLEREVEGP